jgi:hypothetical protein
MEWWGGGLKEMSAGGSESQSNLNWAQTFIYVHAILFVGYATLSSLTKKKKKTGAAVYWLESVETPHAFCTSSFLTLALHKY